MCVCGLCILFIFFCTVCFVAILCVFIWWLRFAFILVFGKRILLTLIIFFFRFRFFSLILLFSFLFFSLPYFVPLIQNATCSSNSHFRWFYLCSNSSFFFHFQSFFSVVIFLVFKSHPLSCVLNARVCEAFNAEKNVLFIHNTYTNRLPHYILNSQSRRVNHNHVWVRNVTRSLSRLDPNFYHLKLFHIVTISPSWAHTHTHTFYLPCDGEMFATHRSLFSGW